MKQFFLPVVILFSCMLPSALKASFSGSTYTADSPATVLAASSNITISNLSAAYSYNTSELLITNSSASPITIQWNAIGHAMGPGSTNQLSLPNGKIAQYLIDLTAVSSGYVTYQSLLEQGYQGSVNTVSLTNNSDYPNGSFITNGLVAYWKLHDNGGSIALDSIGGHNLNLVGGPTWGNNFLTFNGSSQYGDAGNPAALNITGPLTISAWINSASFPGQGGLQVPVEKGYDGSTEGYFMRYYYYYSLNLEDGSWSGAGYVPGNSIPNPNLIGQWYFITTVYDGVYWNLYVNGLLVGKQYGAYGPEISSANLYVGAGSIAGAPARFFNGSIHDVGIYNRALNADEVMTNYINTEFHTNVVNPDLLYLKMSEGATDTVYSPSTPITLNMADSSTLDNTNVIFYYPYTRQWITNVASAPLAALHFNGTASYIDTHNTNSFNFTSNPFTVNFWALPLTGNGFLMQNGGYTNGWYISVGGSFSVVFVAATPNGVSYIQSPSGELSNSGWNMVTCVWDGTAASIYIDGSRVNSSGTFSAPAPSAYSLVIGKDQAGQHFLDGDIWLTQIWGKALSPTDIANLFYNQETGTIWP